MFLSRRSWIISIRPDNLARDHGVLIKCIDGTEAVIAIGDNQLSVAFVPKQQERRQLFVSDDFCPILFHMTFTDTEKRQRGRSKNILRRKFKDFGAFEFFGGILRDLWP